MLLFEDSKYIDLKLPDATLYYYPNLITNEKYFKKILQLTKWQHDDITVYGKTYKQPRLTAFYSENNKTLNYSNISMTPNRFYNELLEIKGIVEHTVDHNFTSCLLNLYRDGNDSNGWHADDEKELGRDPVIASVSFGAARPFHLKHKSKPLKYKLLLEPGSLLLMKGSTQHFWLHQIPKTKKKIGERINLTFRTIK